MVVHKLLGDLSALNSQAKILAGTLQAGQERKRMHDWLVRYAKREGWGGPVLDVVTACGPNSEWQGAPTSVGTDRVLASTTIAKTADDITYQVCDAQRYTMKMTGIGFAKHPTWAGGSMCIAALVDPAATDEPPFSAIDYDRLSWGQQVASIAIKKATGVPLGKSREQLAIARGSLVANHVLYSGEPQRIDERAREQLRGVFADFAGHVRFQQGVFMAWEWLGKDQAKWGAELADALRVLEGVRTVVHRPPKRKRRATRSTTHATGSTPRVAGKQTAKKTRAKSPSAASAEHVTSGRRGPTAGSVTTDLRFVDEGDKKFRNPATGELVSRPGTAVLRLPSGASGTVVRYLVKPGEKLTARQPVVVVDIDGAGETVFTTPRGGWRVRKRRAPGAQLTSRANVASLAK